MVKTARVKFHFNLKEDRKPTITDDGRVDFRNLDLIKNIKEGEILCSLEPPSKGIPGKKCIR